MSTSSPPPAALNFLERWGVILAVLPLFVGGLNRWPVWEAEIWTQRTCVVPFGEMLKLVAEDKHPPLFFIVEWLLLHLHASDAMARLPALVFGLAALAMMQRVATRHLGRVQGWFATLLLALSPYMVCYAANARSGTLTILLGIVALGFGLDLVTGERPRRAAVGLSLSLLVGVYVHYDMFLALGGVALGGIFGLLVDHRPRAERLRRLGLGVGALVVPVLAFLPWLFGPMQQQHIEDPEHAQERTLKVLRYLLWPVGPEYIPEGSTILLLLALVGLFSLLRRNARG
ncbi:MAG TPA: glycosyltransferase family 39 protein, partial [Myxococcota bacterium]|nr:glycosyltransferase family 39 protein [Myxococcota bacterium]